jgi:hypothetical protein
MGAGLGTLALGCGNSGDDKPGAADVIVRIGTGEATLLAFTERCGKPLKTFGECALYEECQGVDASCTAVDIPVDVTDGTVSVRLRQLTPVSIAQLHEPLTVKSDSPAFEVSGVTFPPSHPQILTPAAGSTVSVTQALTVAWIRTKGATHSVVFLTGPSQNNCFPQLQCMYPADAQSADIPAEALGAMLTQSGGPDVTLNARSIRDQQISVPGAHVEVTANPPNIPSLMIPLTLMSP